MKVQSIKHPVDYLKAPLERGRLGPSVMRGEERGEFYERREARAGEALQAAMATDPTASDLQPVAGT